MSQWKGESREAWLVRQRTEHRAWRERNREWLRVYQRGYGRKYRKAHYDRLREYHRVVSRQPQEGVRALHCDGPKLTSRIVTTGGDHIALQQFVII